MEATYNPRYYFDLRKERKNAKNGRVRLHPRRRVSSPALGAALKWIAEPRLATPDNPAADMVEGRQEAC